jgi:hypothetical protein
VTIFEARVYEGRMYLVMELVNGGSLGDSSDELLRDHRKAAQIVELVASAVQHAHEQGVLHRDLKPGNILLDKEGRPRVADFGLARFTEPSAADSSDLLEAPVDSAADTAAHTILTEVGLRPGTPPYMAPEQFEPEFGSLTPRTDVWALGVILYELLTGQRPFQGDAAEIRRQVCSGTRLQLKWPQTSVDSDLRAIVERCLRQKPVDRYPTAGAVSRALAHWGLGASPKARPGQGAGRAVPWVRRHGIAVAGIALALVVLSALVVSASRPRGGADSKSSTVLDDEEKYDRDIQPALMQLRAGQPSVIASNATAEIPHRWRLGGDACILRYSQDDREGASVFASSRGTALLELLSDPDIPAYRIIAEIRQDAAFEDHSNVGVYFAHSIWTGALGRQHSFCRCAFGDLGRFATQFKDANGQAGSHVQFGQGIIGPSVRNPSQSHLVRTPFVFYVPDRSATPPGPWRKVSVEVRPSVATAYWGTQLVGTIPLARWTEWFEFVRNEDRELAGLPGRDSFHGSMGIFLSSASVSIRRIVVEPLNN